jgi:hypothetical protein
MVNPNVQNDPMLLRQAAELVTVMSSHDHDFHDHGLQPSTHRYVRVSVWRLGSGIQLGNPFVAGHTPGFRNVP